MRSRNAHLGFSALVGSVLSIVVGCMADSPSTEVAAGVLGLQCRHGEVELSDIDYTITRAGQPYRSGRFAGDSSEDGFTTTIGPLGVGDGYTITLTAEALRGRNDDSTPCTGTASFAVAASQTTVVAVQLRCVGLPARGRKETEERDAGLDRDNRCPSIDSVRARPWKAAIGETVALETDAHDSDTLYTPLAYTWSSATGVLRDAALRRASFECVSVGKSAITLRVSDGDSRCREESVTIYVHCFNRSKCSRHAAGAGGGVAGSAPRTCGGTSH